MTNLEFNKDKILKEFNNGYPLGCAICNVMNKTDKKTGCYGIKCEKEKMLYWMLQEHEEQIKLKQWEYDLMYKLKGSAFHTWSHLMDMKEKGHFKGVQDTSMSIQYILNNCIIVSDDYEGFEEECK